MNRTPQTDDARASSTRSRCARATVWVIFLGALVLLAWRL